MTAAAIVEPLEALPDGFLDSLSPAGRRVFVDTLARLRPSQRLGIIEWAERHRYVATGSRKGPFRADAVPTMRGILQAYDDPEVREVVVRKPSQIGYTVSVALNVIGYQVAVDPCPMLALFPKDAAAKRFVREKLDPTIRETDVLAQRIHVDKRNDPTNASDYKGFPGGFLQLAGANSPANVKSTDARVVVVEEPDDVSRDVKGQGDAISLAKSRVKTYPDYKVLIGGTPTIEGFSAVSEELKISDWGRYLVRCPHCGHLQRLVWENVEWVKDADVSHPIYGQHKPETARYRCDSDDCGTLWTDREKNDAVRAAMDDPEAGWQATARSSRIAGFDYEGGGELYSTLPESSMENLVYRYLAAKHDERQGKPEKMIEFNNGTLARPTKLKADAPEAGVLMGRVEDYPAWTCPAGGIVLVMSVDVQRGGEKSGEPRLEFLMRAFGRGMESWKVVHDVVIGNPLERATWDALDERISKEVRNLGGGTMPIRAASIDASDGMTSDAVYAYCRRNRARGFMPVKGWNEQGHRQREIFTPPAPVDTTSGDKASKWGLKLYMVGTSKAKDQIHGRLKLKGSGPGRMHFNAGTELTYFEGILAEAKLPNRAGVAKWIQKAGVANEPLDLEVMCLHAAHKLRLHTWDERHWDAAEQTIRQPDLLQPAAPSNNAGETGLSDAGASATRDGEFSW